MPVGADTTTTSGVEESSAIETFAVGSDVGAGTAAPSTGQKSVSATTDTPTFDYDSWEGELDTLPEQYHPVYNRLSSLHESKLKPIQEDLELYKAVVLGNKEDPRLNKLTQELEELRNKHGAVETEYGTHKTKYQELETKHQALQAELDGYYDRVAKEHAEQYKERHKDILADPGKKAELVTLFDQGWDEEAAAELVGTSGAVRDRALAIVAQHNLKGSGHRLAVQQAKAELGRKGNESTTSALLTAGTRGTVNPAHTSGHAIRDLSREEARNEAARIALVHSKR